MKLPGKLRGHPGFGGRVHASLGTATARLSTKIAFEEFHKVVPQYRCMQDQLPRIPSWNFRNPIRLDMSIHQEAKSRWPTSPM